MSEVIRGKFPFDKLKEKIIKVDTKTKTCTVADKKTKTKTLKIAGDATYRTQAEAESGMKIIKVCIN
jgi:hypothetical protein